MIGKLQTNKVKYAIPLFDYIHSLDNIKLAEKIALEQTKINKNLKYSFRLILEMNSKNGINLNELDNFYKICVKDLNLDIIGLMCILLYHKM